MLYTPFVGLAYISTVFATQSLCHFCIKKEVIIYSALSLLIIIEHFNFQHLEASAFSVNPTKGKNVH